MVKVIFPTGVTVNFTMADAFRRNGDSNSSDIVILRGQDIVGYAPSESVIIVGHQGVTERPRPQVHINVNVEKDSIAFSSLLDRL